MSYSGARTIEEFRAKAEFIQVTPAGRAENVPHVLASAPAPAPDYRAEAVSHDL
jgi:IMP dehydrogenase/GMP reductase